MTNNTDDSIYALDALTREAERAGESLVEYLITSLRHAREVADRNALMWRSAKARAARWEEIALDYENVCAGLLCPECDAEPIKVGHDADCPRNGA